MNGKSIVELEALRGLAAIVVLLHHFMLGFTPRLHGLLYPEQPLSLFGTPAFALVNGSAAVIIFFVLSGFVLTLGLFRSGSLAQAITGAAKRWPRLAVTVMITCGFAGLLMALQSYANIEAGKSIPSLWLGWFYTWTSTGILEIPKAVNQGALTFFNRASSYNSNLWTMYYEFWGSMIAIGAAMAYMRFPRERDAKIFLAVAFVVSFIFSPFMSCFLVGVWQAKLYSQGRTWQWRGWQVPAAAVIIVLLLGYHENLISARAEGSYAVLNPITSLQPLRLRVLFHTVAAVLLINAFLSLGSIRMLFGGQIGKALGFLSFPIYLVQIPIICSLSAFVFLKMDGTPDSLKVIATFAVTVAATLLLALPVAYFDRWWVRTLNRLVAGPAGWLRTTIAEAAPLRLFERSRQAP
ncbi:acyltransferase [Rhodopseudomonas sp. B29]|uniref:acyltransferase family protein n=1 Tax=Rhodopseudomonas sp. B29 TaxID=95607 RepID=UPI00034B80B9|nr:acyltransferase [Rhodopseudomonas sp. B29]